MNQPQPKVFAILSLLLVLVLSWFYSYPETNSLPPQSIHHWRQSDCASITYNYYQHNFPPQEPHIFGLVSNNGASALNVTSEVPHYYWLVSRLYKIFGPNDSILRGVNTLLFLLGLMAFMNAVFLISKSYLWSLLCGALLFSAPVLVYYGNNFLTNTPALGMALIGLYFLVRFQLQSNKAFWWLSVPFFLIAGALKLPGLFLFFSVIGAFTLYPKAKGRVTWLQLSLSVLLVVVPLLLWVAYARGVNLNNNTVYFSTTLFPIWEMNTSDIKYVFSEINKLWLEDYYHFSAWLALAALLATIVLRPQWFSRFWRLILGLLSVGLLLYSTLQFYTFMQHDYYVINMYMLVAVILVAFSTVSRVKPKVLHTPWLLVPLLGLVLFNLSYAQKRHNLRYEGYRNSVSTEFSELYSGIETWLSENSVSPSDSIIFIADGSHTSLHLMKRFGWTTHKMAFKDTDSDVYFNRDSTGIAKSIVKGAHFLVLNNWHDLYNERSYAAPFCKNLVAQKGKLMVFDLKTDKQNFQLPARPQSFYRLQNFEDTVATPIISIADAPSGSNVLAVSPSEQFVLSQDIPEIAAGSTVEVKFWRLSDPAKKVVPVIASLQADLAFEEGIIVTEERGPWQHLSQRLLINDQLAERGVRIFAWNPEQSEFYLDDFEVIIYAPPLY